MFIKKHENVLGKLYTKLNNIIKQLKSARKKNCTMRKDKYVSKCSVSTRLEINFTRNRLARTYTYINSHTCTNTPSNNILETSGYENDLWIAYMIQIAFQICNPRMF